MDLFRCVQKGPSSIRMIDYQNSDASVRDADGPVLSVTL